MPIKKLTPEEVREKKTQILMFLCKAGCSASDYFFVASRLGVSLKFAIAVRNQWKIERYVFNYGSQTQLMGRESAMSRDGRELEANIKGMIRQMLENPPAELTQAMFDHSGLRARLGALEARVNSSDEFSVPADHLNMHHRTDTAVAAMESRLTVMERQLNDLQKRQQDMAKSYKSTKTTSRGALKEFFNEWLGERRWNQNAGDYWTAEEDKQLLDTLNALLGPVGDMHGRSAGAIRSRLDLLLSHGVKLFRGAHNNLGYLRKIRYYDDD